MNEVEKMYSNAGIEKYYCSFESSDGNVYNWELNEDGEEKYNKCFLGKPKIKQRSFTAEKQIELIKWIAEHKEECRITYEKEYKWCMQTDWQSSFCYDNEGSIKIEGFTDNGSYKFEYKEYEMEEINK